MNAPASPAVRTTCAYCGVGCGVLATPDGRGGASIAGDPDHPANFGRLCSKGSALGETLSTTSRLLHPMLRQRDGCYTQVDWSTALDRVAAGFATVLERDGPDAIAFYLSGQLLTEDYYVANKLMKGFLGSANVDTNSRLCMASSVAGHRRAFGADTVPGNYEDLDEADLIVLVGSNAAWCHPVLYQRMIANKRSRGAKLVVIDPRRTATAEEADLFLPIAPGADASLFAGLLVDLAERLALDFRYIDAHTAGFEATLARARALTPDVAATARATGLAEADVAAFFELFRSTDRTVTAFSQGVNQSAQGTDKVNAIINCHLATGRIGKSGMGPLSLTGQPNAMGGREVGGLANQLAAHMGFGEEEIDRVRRFWTAPRMAEHEGLKAVDMFRAIARGQIKALWVMATNPAVSLPRAGAMREALSKLDLLVVSDNVAQNDTIGAGPHVLLPAAAWGEKDGTVTNSERRISRQRTFVPYAGEARPDWWIVSEVARRMGFGDAFAYRSAADIFREHAALSAFENDGARDFDLGGLAALTDSDFDQLAPVQWPVRSAEQSTARLFATGTFFTDDGKARFVAPAPPVLHESASARYPFILNTGRVRDQWHSMTRTGLSPRLAGHVQQPFVEVHPADAARLKLADGGFADVATKHGTCVLKVRVSDAQRAGSLFAPIHWSDMTASRARVGDLVTSATDPYSGQPEAKATPAAIRPIHFRYRGFALGRAALPLPVTAWWAQVAVAGGVGRLFATNEEPASWRALLRQHLAAHCEIAEFIDDRAGAYRLAAFADGRIEACLFAGAEVPAWDHAKALFEAATVTESDWLRILSGRAIDGAAHGPPVCACFGVSRATIEHGVKAGATSVEAIGAALRAGTNCGSCLPELKKIVGAMRPGLSSDAPPAKITAHG
jgi:assimilatory nitrate reductase catalytic subunit